MAEGKVVGHQSSEQSLVVKHRIRSWHRVAAQDEAILHATEKPMQKEPPITECEHDFAPPDVCDGTARDLDICSRPKRREHTFAMHLQA